MQYDLIIIGAGPAGATAGIYSARQKLKTLIISKDIGGQLSKKAVDIENYPGFKKISGMDLADLLSEQLKDNGVEIALTGVKEVKKDDNLFKITCDNGKTYESLAVVATSGAKPRELGAKGEREFVGRGVSYCALCDGPVFRDKSVAVIGGGNSGFESALFLSNYVKDITILEFGKEVKADKENQEHALKSGKVKVITEAKVKEIKGDKFVESVIYDSPEGEQKLEVSGVFIEIGYAPDTAFLKDLAELTERGEIISNLETLETKTPGLFVAGDANKGKYKQIIISAGEGAKAALSVYEYIKKNQK